jgi:hypothetical protein
LRYSPDVKGVRFACLCARRYQNLGSQLDGCSWQQSSLQYRFLPVVNFCTTECNSTNTINLGVILE